MLLFSATYDHTVMQFAQKIIPNDPVIIRLRREEESLDNIKQYYIECTSELEKYQALCNIYGSISVGQSMIFCHVSWYFYRNLSSLSFNKKRQTGMQDTNPLLVAMSENV